MYKRFFGFKERPFKLVPNPEFLYLSRIHEEVLAHLNYAAGYGEGFVEITGEVGTGKTTLCRMFLESLDETTEAAYIFNPKLDALQLLKAINDEFGIPSETDSVKILIDTLNAFLLEKKAQGKRVILLVDEAQNLSADVLEQLRLLSNLETTTSKLLQIILVGQPELGELLDSDNLRQLNQRITLSCHLVPLTLAETRDYIRHRIHIASKKPGPEFSPGAFRSIFRYSRGVPRLINIACDRALLTAFTLGKHRVTNSLVKRALHELEGKRGRARKPMLRREKLTLGLLTVLVLLVAGLVVGQILLNRTSGLTVAPVVHHKIQSPPLPPPPEAPEVPDAADQAVVSPPPQAAVLPTEPALQKMPEEPPPAEAAALEPTPIDLAQVVGAMDANGSRRGALTAVLNTWKIQTTTESLDPLEDDTFFRISAGQRGMEALKVKGNLDLIRKLNLPAILEFPLPDGGGTRFMAVVGLANDDIRLSNGEGIYAVAPFSLAGLWNGVAHILWKNYFNYNGVIPISSPGEAIISLKAHLKSLGFPIEEMSAAYDAATRRAVETIQARNGLEVDGMVGPLTKIALYNTDASLAVPRLNGASARDEGQSADG